MKTDKISVGAVRLGTHYVIGSRQDQDPTSIVCVLPGWYREGQERQTGLAKL